MPALASDRVFCNIIAASAVHAAFGGLTNAMVGRVSQRYVYVPLNVVNDKNKPVVKETSRMYNRMIRATGQPSFTRQGSAKIITGRGDVRRAFTVSLLPRACLRAQCNVSSVQESKRRAEPVAMMPGSRALCPLPLA